MTECDNSFEYKFNEDEKVYVLIAMLGAIVVGFIAPLIIYLLQKDKLSEGANYYVRGMLNFQILMLCISAFLIVINIIPLLGTLICALACPIVILFNLIVVVIASVKAFDYKPFKYPINHDFI